MFTDADLWTWYARVEVSEQTRAVIDHIRSSDPARRVGGGCRNVSGRYPSRKMGVTIQFESHRVELAAVHELEHDPDVLEYFDQPPRFKLDYKSVDGRRLGVLHTADYFVIRQSAAGWEECKTEEELLRLNERNSNRYARNEGGNWVCPPGEAHATALGLYYRVRSSRDIDWVYQRNVLFLEDYWRVENTIAPANRETVLAHVGATPGILLDQLLDATASLVSRDDVYSLIASGAIYVDLHHAPFSEASKVAVFVSKDSARKESSGTPPTTIAADAGITKRLVGGNERELQIANNRLQHVLGYLADPQTATEGQIPARTLRRWVALYRKAERELGSGYLGLLPLPPHGNSTRKLPEETWELMNQVIATDYETVKQKTRYASWIALKLACNKRGVHTPSFKTFSLAVGHRAGFEQTLKRRGHRAAYEQEEFYWALESTTPRHGDRPFEIAHIDHTELDVETVCRRTGKVLGRPWMTLLTDAFSRRILAVYLTFDPPSYRSCMMVLRECVRRHARLPQIAVVDGGKEFQSTYFETLLARYECTNEDPATRQTTLWLGL